MSPTFAKNAKVGQPPQPQYNFDSKNRITSASGIIYDAAGNVINDGTHTYTYDAENRMITVDSSAQAYFYDAFGRQIQTIYGGNTYSRIFGLNGRAEVQFSGNTWMLSELYVGSVGDYLGNYSNGTTYFAHRDQVGNRRMYTGPSGSVVETCAGLPFGDGENCTGASTGSVTDFTGQDWDPNTKLTRFPARNYSMQQGRWMHPDPAGLAAVDPSNPQTWNRYAYVSNNPLSHRDPLGLFIVDCMWEDCYGGETGGGGGGYLDGAPQSVISSLGGNGQAPCPNGVCDGFTSSGDYFQFVAGAGGATGYVRFSDMQQGMYEANGTFMSGSQYNAYVQSTYASQIDAQRRALAQAIAANSGISYEQAYASLDPSNGHLQGGNYNFDASNGLGPNSLDCGGDARCNGVHFPGQDANGSWFVHLDTSNPFTGPVGFFEHGFVDLFLGNVAYTVIPRPWP